MKNGGGCSRGESREGRGNGKGGRGKRRDVREEKGEEKIKSKRRM